MVDPSAVASPPSIPEADHEPCSSRSSRGFRSPEEFTAIVEPLLPDLVRMARRYLQAEDLAWDAVQESLLRLWVGGWLPVRPRPALRSLVAKSCLHQLRCLARRRTHEARVPVEEFACEDPLHVAQRAEEVSEVQDVLASITQEYRQVFELFEFHGQSYEEISEKLGLPVGTVRSRLSRARSKVRERLAVKISAA